jgi:hypothetical protein
VPNVVDVTHQPRRDPLTDRALSAEIELLTDLILAVGHRTAHLSEDEIDNALGLAAPTVPEPSPHGRPRKARSGRLIGAA